MDLRSLRREYDESLRDGLEAEDLAADPLEQFDRWMGQMLALGVADPTAMTAATADADGQPSQRVVLLKGVDRGGFVFYTSYRSRKARELRDNRRISLHFPWHGADRQVKVCGVAEKLPARESAAYFASRPRDSRLAAAASPQSEPLASRGELLRRVEALKERCGDGEIPCPGDWGGYRVRPHEMEFWQGRPGRLHDRFRYRLAGGRWKVERLAP